MQACVGWRESAQRAMQPVADRAFVNVVSQPELAPLFVSGLSSAAYGAYQEEIGVCEAFRPAFEGALAPGRPVTHEGLNGAVAAAWRACGVSPMVGTAIPVVPSEGDRVGAAALSLDATTSDAQRVCNQGWVPLCDSGRERLPRGIAVAVMNGSFYGGAQPGADVPGDLAARTERVRARAVELTNERLDQSCSTLGRVGGFLSPFHDGCTDEAPPPPDLGFYDQSALATAAKEEALASGWSEADAQALHDDVLAQPW